MKRAVSVSLGSVTRDKSVEIEMFGEKVLIERIGTDGDVDKAIEVLRTKGIAKAAELTYPWVQTSAIGRYTPR